MGRNRIYNDPAVAASPARCKTIAVPISETLRSRYEVAPAKVEFWGMAIPRNSRRKELAWSFIKAMLTKEATLGAALNGNGPVRNSTYDDPRMRELIPYGDEERRVLRVARVPLPAFDEAPRRRHLQGGMRGRGSWDEDARGRDGFGRAAGQAAAADVT